MKRKSYTKTAEQKAAKKELEDKTPIVVRFFSETCGACQNSRPAWDQFSAEMAPSSYRIVEIEQEAIPPEILEAIRAFPTYAKSDANGEFHVQGAITDAPDIKKKLKL
jgi:thiol-disulfide isomerase/thioredoxin